MNCRVCGKAVESAPIDVIGFLPELCDACWDAEDRGETSRPQTPGGREDVDYDEAGRFRGEEEI